MNSTQQAKNGFKTFLVTFLVSVLVFGVFYYLISDVSTENVSIESADSTVSTGLGKTKSVENEPTTKPEVAGTSDVADTSDIAGPNMEVVDNAEKAPEGSLESPFGDLASEKIDVQGSSVLQAATTTTPTATTPESTQTPVPSTGDFSITFGIVSSLALFGFFAYIVFLNPRKYALARFEQDLVDNLK